MQDSKKWTVNSDIYVLLSTDAEGFAAIHSLSETRPTDNRIDFVKAKARYMSRDKELFIDFPFNRFYMEESKAPLAEQIYRETNRDKKQEAYALVNVKDGEAVLKDVLIKGVSIRELAKEN